MGAFFVPAINNVKIFFVVWQYNAYKYDVEEHQLNEPLPKIDRERT